MPKPTAKAATLDFKEVQDLVDQFVRKMPPGVYQQNLLADHPLLAKILALPELDQCAIATHVAQHLTNLYKRRNEHQAKHGSENPWITMGGLPVSLLLQRLLMKKLPFSAEQLSSFCRFLCAGGADSFTVAPVVGALIKGLERGVLTPADPTLQAVANALAKSGSTTNVPLATRFTAALKDAAPVADTRSPEQPLPDLSPLEALLLNRAELKPATGALTDQMLTALNQPKTDDDATAASFSISAFPSDVAIITHINEVLARQGTRYLGHGTEAEIFGPQATALTTLGSRAIAFAAAAAAAMTMRPLKLSWGSPASLRYYNGLRSLFYTIPFALSNSDELDNIGLVADALSRVRNLEFVHIGWGRFAEPIIEHLKNVDLSKANQPTLIALLRFRERLSRGEDPRDRGSVRSFDEITGIGRGLYFELGEPWSDRLYQDLRACKPAVRASWIKLLEHCVLASTSKPTTKWNQQADTIIAAFSKDAILNGLASWFPLVGKNRPSIPGGKIEGRDSSVPSDRAGDVLRGLAWIASRFDTPRSAKALGDLAMAGYKMVPGVGARCSKPATAAVAGLADMKNSEALAQLSRIRQLVKFGTAKKVLDTALNKLAKELNISTDELHEVAAPDFGLDSNGAIREEVGDYTLELRIEGPSAEVRIFDEHEKELKSTPDALKKDATLKQLKALADDIDKMLPAQKDRLERLYHDERQWPAATWRARYISHPLVGTLARRLIWNFTRGKSTTSAFWHDDGFIDAAGKGIEVADEDTVSLWHPSLASTKDVTAWRNFLESRQEGGIKQPFKQAHREVYLLTDAERRTSTYSNRFAAHIIKQNQLNALCQARGWKHTLYVHDSGEPPMLSLPKWNLHAHFLVEPIGDDYFGNSGAYAYLQTDQVAFSRTPRDENLPLSEIPPLAFSEVMRDVDLFIGVCSVGNNPDWQDGGPEGRYRDYWWNYGFGDLTGSGDTRKELLSRLIPKLKIAPQCELDGRFLKVQGKLRTYKIHLGSGNILMEPNDQYLCIVPGRDQESKVYLPFEGDRVLAIILSKAFMLAADDRITDQTITRQIGRPH